jgi:hypothetical protein
MNEKTMRNISGMAVALPLLLLACHPGEEPGDVSGHADVLTVIRAHGGAAVMIALVHPPGFGDPAGDGDAIRGEIARMQEGVLAALDSADFRLRQRFASIPAMAGTLRTEQGLRVLLAHPYVRRVDLDPSGGGTARPPGG